MKGRWLSAYNVIHAYHLEQSQLTLREISAIVIQCGLISIGLIVYPEFLSTSRHYR